MSMAERGNPGNITSRLVENEKARDCLIPMGITSENVAERFGISREKQDAFALASQQKAARAQSRGCFRAEIVPVSTTVCDDKGRGRSVTVAQDEGICPGTTMEGLAKLTEGTAGGLQAIRLAWRVTCLCPQGLQSLWQSLAWGGLVAPPVWFCVHRAYRVVSMCTGTRTRAVDSSPARGPASEEGPSEGPALTGRRAPGRLSAAVRGGRSGPLRGRRKPAGVVGAPLRDARTQ